MNDQNGLFSVIDIKDISGTATLVNRKKKKFLVYELKCRASWNGQKPKENKTKRESLTFYCNTRHIQSNKNRRKCSTCRNSWWCRK